MNRRLLLTSSALILGICALAATFLPQETLSLLKTDPSPVPVLLTQILGALYFGFAMLNWMARGNLLGGVYGRPVVLANLFHFTIAGLALAKQVARGSSGAAIIGACVIYVAFAIAFGGVMFSSPVTGKEST